MTADENNYLFAHILERVSRRQLPDARRRVAALRVALYKSPIGTHYCDPRPTPTSHPCTSARTTEGKGPW